MKYNPALLRDSVNKSLEFLEQGKLRGPHVSGEFELDQVNNITLEQTIAIFYLTNRFQVAMHLFSNTSQMMSKCGQNKKVVRKVQLSVSLMFLPHFDVHCDLLLNRRTATQNLFVLYNKELENFLMMMSSIRLSSNRSQVRTNQNACITELII